MAMRLQHPGPRFDLPISLSRPVHLAVGEGSPGAIDVSVCEWTTDLSVGPHPDRIPARRTAVSGVGFVDFDGVDSIHETTASVGNVQP